MAYYQLTYLIPDNFSEEEIKTLREKIDNLIQKEEGILGFAQQDMLIRKNLGYPIRNKQSVYLISLNFNLDAGRLENLEKKLSAIDGSAAGGKAESQILRYVILVKKMPKKIPEISIKPKKLIKPKPKVELKEIEKKLEEILNE